MTGIGKRRLSATPARGALLRVPSLAPFCGGVASGPVCHLLRITGLAELATAAGFGITFWLTAYLLGGLIARLRRRKSRTRVLGGEQWTVK